MHCVIGVGDGQRVAELQASGERVVALSLCEEQAPKNVETYAVRSGHDARTAACLLFGTHVSAVDLVDAVFHVEHSVGRLEEYRQRVLQEFFRSLESVPHVWGNSTIDGLCGLVNVATNAEQLLGCPGLRRVTDAPAIAVGAGPSLGDHLDELRELSRSCVIVACDAALRPLCEAGVTVHAVTPLERLNSTAAKMAEGTAQLYAGTPVVPPAAVRGCEQYAYVPQGDGLYDWLERRAPRPYVGSTSGSMAVAVALALTNGPLYLVGLDLCPDGAQTHVDGAASAEHFDLGHSAVVRHNGGGAVRTRFDWARSATEISTMIHGRRAANVGAAEGRGVLIPGTVPERLPSGLPDMEAIQWPDEYDSVPNQTWCDRARHLGSDWLDLVNNVCFLKELSGLQLDVLMPKRNVDAVSYLLRPLLAQLSVERRLGRDERQLLGVAQERLANMTEQCLDVLEEVADVAACGFSR